MRTVNACTDPDLFWAIKGGGGSLGVITKVTLRTRELPAFFGGAFLTIKATSDAGGRPARYPGFPNHEPDLGVARKQAGEIAKSMDELRKIVPDAGSYVSESNFFEPSWQRSYWGPNYRRLPAVKAKYDPACLFFVHHGVGSEEWSADGFARVTGPKGRD